MARAAPPQNAQTLAQRLRVAGPSELAALVNGPVVAVDLTTGSITTLCHDAAVQAAHDWGVKLADSSRSTAECSPSPGAVTETVCVQIAGTEMLYLQLDGTDEPRLRAAMEGQFPSPHVTAQLLHQLLAQLATDACP